MLNATEKSAILEKIRACLALAANPGAAPGEAETAARQAMKLMAKYDIEESEVDGTTGLHKFKFAKAKARHLCGEGKAPIWTGIISLGVAKALFCHAVIISELIADEVPGAELDIANFPYNKYKNVRVVQRFEYKGVISDVKLAVWLTETLINQGKRECAEAGIVGERAKSQWLVGWASAVQTRLIAMSSWVASESTGASEADGGTSLVVLNEKRAAVEEKFGASCEKKNKVKSDMEGYVAGMNTNISLNRPIESADKPLSIAQESFK